MNDSKLYTTQYPDYHRTMYILEDKEFIIDCWLLRADIDNAYPSNRKPWTYDRDILVLEGVPDSKRAFYMGNALVVGAIEIVGRSLSKKR